MIEPRRDEDRHLPPAAVLASVLLHAGAGLLFLRASPSLASTPPPQTYQVKLVAQMDEEAPVRQDPQPAEAAEEEHRPPPPEPSPLPKPETELPSVEKEEEVPEPTKEPARAEEQGEETVNVQLDGRTFPFPDYLENIISQVNRYWRPPSGARSLEAEIAFVIDRNGSVTDIEWVHRSGDLTFDLEARGAVEAAGRAQAFGPLPERYPRDRLRVSFFFDPSTR